MGAEAGKQAAQRIDIERDTAGGRRKARPRDVNELTVIPFDDVGIVRSLVGKGVAIEIPRPNHGTAGGGAATTALAPSAPQVVDDDEDVEERLRVIHEELVIINDEAAELTERITAAYGALI